MMFVLASKLVQVFGAAYTLKYAVDRMSGGDRGAVWIVVALVLGYAGARLSTHRCSTICATSCSNASGRKRRGGWRRRCSATSTGCRCASTSNAAPARSPRWSSAGPRASTRCCISCCSTSRRRCSNSALVLGIFWVNFGVWLVVATVVMVVIYIAFTRAVTDWRNALAHADERPRHRRGRACGRFAAQFRDGEIFRRRGARGAALRRCDPRLCQCRGEEREQPGAAQYRPGGDHQCDARRRDGVRRVGLEPGALSRRATRCSCRPCSASCSARSTCSAWSIARSARA